MQEMTERRWGMNGFVLKWIAMISMVIDHTGMVLFPQYPIMRVIGRLAFPIYCFLLVEGAVHTSNRKRYLGRLFLFALISEVPFDLVVTGRFYASGNQNVFFTLFLGLTAIFLLDSTINKGYSVILSIALIFFAELIAVDYGGGGVFLILLFYVFRNRFLVKSAAVTGAVVFVYGGIENYAILSLIPILCYNGRRGPRMKYFFYIFYPAHLLLLYLLRLWMPEIGRMTGSF